MKRLLLSVGLLAAGALLLFGGGGGSAGPGAGAAPEPGSSAVLTQGSGTQSGACPQLLSRVPRVHHPDGSTSWTATGCEFRFHAGLPAGWHAYRVPATVFPPPGPPSTLVIDVPSFSNSTTFGGETRPFSMTPGHVVINIDGGFKASAHNLARFTPPNLAPSDFRLAANRDQTDTAHARLIFGGYTFQATVYAHHGDETPAVLSDVNGVLNSMTATERSCPCK